MKCQGKHTKFQLSVGTEWACPKCGRNNEFFYLEDWGEFSHDDCDLIHEDDEYKCHHCGLVWTGVELAKILEEKTSSCECPTCNGLGWVSTAAPSLYKALKAVEFIEVDYEEDTGAVIVMCPSCRFLAPKGTGCHADDCELDAALKAAEGKG